MKTPTRSQNSPDALTLELAAAARLRTINFLRDSLEHELRSPLNAVVLNVELLKELARKEGGATAVIQLERLDSISGAITRLQQGLGDLMNLTERVEEPRTRFELGGAAADLATLVGGKIRQRGLNLEVDLPEGLPIRGRRETLTHALLQLMIRAMQASPPKGRIVLSARRLDEGLAIDVRDFGPGIEPELRERLFELHQDPAGNGLHVARKLIEADGGELSLVSSGSEGTVLRALFPEARA